MSEKKNPYCKQCLSYGNSCPGVRELTAETEGCMHCFEKKSLNEKKNIVRRLEKKLNGVRGRIRELKQEEKYLTEELKTKR